MKVSLVVDFDHQSYAFWAWLYVGHHTVAVVNLDPLANQEADPLMSFRREIFEPAVAGVVRVVAF
jgi:hypothetical protein